MFSEQIKAARDKLNVSQHQASLAISPLLSTRTFQNWEQGTSRPPAWAQHMILERLELASFETPLTGEFRSRLQRAMDANDAQELRKLWKEGIDAYD